MPHSQPPLHSCQPLEASSISSPNKFITSFGQLTMQSYPPLPRQKQLAPLTLSSMTAVPSKNPVSSRNHLERCRSPSKPPSPLLSLHSPISLKHIHHVTSTLNQPMSPR